MSEFKERLKDEALELGNKVRKLRDFIDNNPKFKELSEDHQRLLTMQLSAMSEYREILGERLWLLEKE